MPFRKEIKKVLVIGSGPIVIGQAAEFDYAGTQACLALKEEGIEVILANNNPATIMTDSSIADSVYMEPLTLESLESIIAKEKPDGIIGTLGGQTGLNATVELYNNGILEKYGVELLGTSVSSIQQGEDREKFRDLMIKIHEPIPESKIIQNLDDGVQFVKEIGFPVIIRPAYTLGGAGGGFAHNMEELEVILNKGLSASPIHQVLLERSIRGWKEIEYEVMRDENDTCIIVCNMENMDPVGVHTGDSIVVAPSQTLSDVQYQMLRNASLKVIRALKIVGGCNIQFAIDPESNQYYIIEVNPRVSRSSALASKATGYPIARMAAKCAVGYNLDELLNPITGSTYASFEPAIDYIVVKLPRFPFDKFPEADRSLGTQMKATGEVMAIDRTFEGALNKAIRSLEQHTYGLSMEIVSRMENDELIQQMIQPTDVRIFVIAESLRRGFGVEKVVEHTNIDSWFIEKLKGMINLEELIQSYEWNVLPVQLLQKAKQQNISDRRLSQLFQIEEKEVRQKIKDLGWRPSYKLVDTCAAEFDAITPYYYSTWHGYDEVEPTDKRKVLVLGSGPIRIGQGVEFDYASVHAALALKNSGYEAVVMNNNPETVSTDYSIADRLYFEPLTTEDVLYVVEKEKVDGVLVQFGGQTAINLAKDLRDAGVKIFGTDVDNIHALEDRKQFYHLLDSLEIPRIKGSTASKPKELLVIARELGYPVLVRPSYVIGGQSMFVFHAEEELYEYCSQLEKNKNEAIWPLLVDQYIPGLECEIDVISDGQEIIIPGIFEHIERAGVHSGDSISIFPPVQLSEREKGILVEYAYRLARAVPIVGLMNIQFVLSEQVIYVIEVNPRSSRTVPVISKVTGIPMIEWGTRVQLGEHLQDIHNEVGLLKPPTYYTIKAPVFSASKLKGVDHVLGPEMKSTGEVLGIGYSKEEAMRKALFYHNIAPFSQSQVKDTIFCSIADSAKEECVEMIKELVNRSFVIIGTKGTVTFLKEQGVPAREVDCKDNSLVEIFKKGVVSAVINIPTRGRINNRKGFYIRELSVLYDIPYFTCIDTVIAALEAEEEKENQEIQTISQYIENKRIVKK